RLQPVLEWDGELPAIRDPHDQHVLACALASRADYLITGDKDFGAVIDLLDTQVISVQEFFKRLVVSRNP
ncbi:MAG: putative toxin-antitoxin system toxin component, PIN family, partial [bacterium]